MTVREFAMGARPQINGNSKDDFEEAYRELSMARAVVESAARTVRMNVLHARNYQHLTHAEGRAAIEEDLRVLTGLRSGLDAIDAIQREIIKALR